MVIASETKSTSGKHVGLFKQNTKIISIKSISGKHVWHVSGDFACSTQDQTISLSLRLPLVDVGLIHVGHFDFFLFRFWLLTLPFSFLAPAALRSSHAQMASALISSKGLYLIFRINFSLFLINYLVFWISFSLFLNINKRCDNLNDCRDKSDEANCKRVGGFTHSSSHNVAQVARAHERRSPKDQGLLRKEGPPTYAILSQNLVLSRFTRFLKGHHRAFYESHPALGVFSTKVSLLLKGFQQKSACFRRAFGEPAFVELSESFRRAYFRRKEN